MDSPTREEGVPLNLKPCKISIGDDSAAEVKKFTGLSKQELLDEANSPFWVRLRWALSILFWIIWLSILVSSVYIVYAAPKCKQAPSQQWYQDTVLYKVDPKNFAQNYEGMSTNMRYFKEMKSCLVLTGQNALAAAGQSPNQQLDDLLKAAHESKVKVLLEVKVDAVPLSIFAKQGQSLKPSCGNPPCYPDWVKVANVTSGLHNNTEINGTSAVQYDRKSAHDYLAATLKSWLGRDIDGFFISDLSKIDGPYASKVVETVWSTVGDFVTEVPRALFVEASVETDALRLAKLFTVVDDESVGAVNPIMVFTSLPKKPTGLDFKSTVERVRASVRGVFAYENKAQVGRKDQSLALSLLNLLLPGVAVMRSGEELGDQLENTFKWDESVIKYKPIAVAADDQKRFALSMTLNAIKKTTVDTFAKESLRYDTQSNDTNFFFFNTGNDKVVAFCRQWHNKKPVIVVSNFDTNKQTFTLDYKTCSEELSEAKVLISSRQDIESLKIGASIATAQLNSLGGHTTFAICP